MSEPGTLRGTASTRACSRRPGEPPARLLTVLSSYSFSREQGALCWLRFPVGHSWCQVAESFFSVLSRKMMGQAEDAFWAISCGTVSEQGECRADFSSFLMKAQNCGCAQIQTRVPLRISGSLSDVYTLGSVVTWVARLCAEYLMAPRALLLCLENQHFPWSKNCWHETWFFFKTLFYLSLCWVMFKWLITELLWFCYS